jgi:hypothetical protein
MKKIILFLFFIIGGLTLKAASDKEMVIIRVEYSAKKTGIESKLYCDIGVSNIHSLYRALTNQENTVQIKDENDKINVFSTEVDLMNYLFTLGYKFESTFITEIINNKYTNFILIKE